MSETTRSLIVMLRANTQPFSDGLRSAESSLSALKGNAARLSADFRNQISAAGTLSADDRERRRIQQQFEQGLEKIGRLRNLDVETGKQLVAEAEKLRAIQMQAVDDRASEERRRAAWEASEAAAKISAQLREQQGLLAAATEFERERLSIATRHASTLERIKSAPGLDDGARGRLENQAETLRMAQLADVNRREAAKAAAEASARDRQRAVELQGQADAAKRVSSELRNQLSLTTATTAVERAKLLAEQQYVANLERINALKGIDRAQTLAMIADAKRLRAAQLEAAQSAGSDGPLGGLGSILGNSDGARKLMRGVGAAMMIGIASEMAARTADAIGSVSRGILEGKKPWQELTQEGVNALPIAGSVNKALSSIGAATMDTAAATAKWLGYSKEVQRSLMSGAALQADIAAQAAETEKRWAAMERSKAISKEIDDQLDVMREMTPLQRERQRIEEQYLATVAKVRAQTDLPTENIREELERASRNRRLLLAYAEDAPNREGRKKAKEQIEALQAERAEIGKTAAEIAYMRAEREKLGPVMAEAIRLNVEMNERGRANQQALDLAKAWKEQAETLGMTSEQIEIYRLKLAGASEENLRAADAARKQLEAARLQNDVNELSKSLREQKAMLGMTAEQAAIYKLQIRGATEEQIRGLQSQAKQLELAREQQKEVERLKSKAESVKESTRTPLETYRKEIEDLKKMFAAGLIDRETASRAAIAAGKNLRDAQGQLKSESPAERAPTLALRGSAEEYRLMYAGRFDDKTDKEHLKMEERAARGIEQVLAELRRAPIARVAKNN